MSWQAGEPGPDPCTEGRWSILTFPGVLTWASPLRSCLGTRRWIWEEFGFLGLEKLWLGGTPMERRVSDTMQSVDKPGTQMSLF